MSILKYVCPKEKSDLPDLTCLLSEKVHSAAIATANVKVTEAPEETQGKKSSCGPCLSMTSAQKYKLGNKQLTWGYSKYNIINRGCVRQQLQGIY